jgi:glycine C-acetyltransferase
MAVRIISVAPACHGAFWTRLFARKSGILGTGRTGDSSRVDAVTPGLWKNHWTGLPKGGSMAYIQATASTAPSRRMNAAFLSSVTQTLDTIRADGFWKAERRIATPQDSHITLADGTKVLNFCANNYLGLADDSRLIAAAKQGLDAHGFGMASVRFICGTQTLHKDLEAKLSGFLGTDDTILYGSCFDANGGLFETLLGQEDAVISDELNHASIIDGIRLCKAQRYRYLNSDMGDLEAKLKEASGARFRLIATDGVFSMDGYIANLAGICDLAEQYRALVMVDDSHATGFMGPGGRGTPEHCGVAGRIDFNLGRIGSSERFTLVKPGDFHRLQTSPFRI